MKNCDLEFLNRHRITDGPYRSVDICGPMGMFSWEKKGCVFTAISSGEHGIGTGWEHVSISKRQGHKLRMPTWDDMCFVKKVFWGDDETVIQFHPKASANVNFHPTCLHLWKKYGVEYELPPSILVGPQ